MSSTSGMYRDLLSLHAANDFFHVRNTVRNRALAANNLLSFPSHSITTDIHGIVTTVSDGFLSFTGYTKEKMLGRSCNFLQGKDTAQEDVIEIRLALQKKQEICVVILNYRKNGVPFWNILTIHPQYRYDKNLSVDAAKESVVGLASRPTPKPVLSYFSSEIIGLPIPPAMQQRPKLCLEDALALITVFSSIPKTVTLLPPPVPTGTHKNSTVELKPKSTLSRQKHSRSKGKHKVHHESECDATKAKQQTDSIPISQNEPFSKNLSVANYNRAISGSADIDIYKHIKYSNLTLTTTKSISSQLSGPRFLFVAETSLPTIHGRYRVRAYRDPISGAEPLAIIYGAVEDSAEVICRVHDQCVTSEVFGSLRCDCKQQLDYSLAFIKENGVGMVLYLPQEGRGIGLANKIAAYGLQEMGFDTVDANRELGLPDDARRYDAVKDILEDLRIESLRLLTNNPRKIECLKELGVKVNGRIECFVKPNNEYSSMYVQAKAERMGHMIDVESLK